MRPFQLLLPGVVLALLSGCSVMPAEGFPREEHVDLDRYMGTWYVIAHIPPGPTENAYNAIERYEQVEPGRIHTVYTYREAGFDGERKAMEPVGTVIGDSGNAVWAMRFYGVLRMQYVISYVDPNYQTTIVARDKRDYVWIMARTPQIDEAIYQALVERVTTIGYNTDRLRRVPQQPLFERGDG